MFVCLFVHFDSIFCILPSDCTGPAASLHLRSLGQELRIHAAFCEFLSPWNRLPLYTYVGPSPGRHECTVARRQLSTLSQSRQGIQSHVQLVQTQFELIRNPGNRRCARANDRETLPNRLDKVVEPNIGGDEPG